MPATKTKTKTTKAAKKVPATKRPPHFTTTLYAVLSACRYDKGVERFATHEDGYAIYTSEGQATYALRDLVENERGERAADKRTFRLVELRAYEA